MPMRFISVFNTKTASLLCLLLALVVAWWIFFLFYLLARTKGSWCNKAGIYLKRKDLPLLVIFVQYAEIRGLVFVYPSWKKNVFQKTIACIFSILLFIEITHNIYFHTKAAFNPAKYSLTPTENPENPDDDYFIRTLQTTERNNPGAEIYVVADNDDMYPWRANYCRHKGNYDGFNFADSSASPEKANDTNSCIVWSWNEKLSTFSWFRKSPIFGQSK